MKEHYNHKSLDESIAFLRDVRDVIAEIDKNEIFGHAVRVKEQELNDTLENKVIRPLSLFADNLKAYKREAEMPRADAAGKVTGLRNMTYYKLDKQFSQKNFDPIVSAMKKILEILKTTPEENINQSLKDTMQKFSDVILKLELNFPFLETINEGYAVNMLYKKLNPQLNSGATLSR